MRLVECVPNYSEGRRREVVEEIVKAIESVEGVKVIDWSMDADHNRSVVTCIAPPEKAVEAMLRGAEVAVKHIDLRHHQGEHPRMGAVDVVPFVPLMGVSMKDCVELAYEFGQKLWETLKVPVYFYAEAAKEPHKYRLPDIRKGEFEGLPEKMKDPKWYPDVGEPQPHPSAGATVTGARQFLIAYNVYLNTPDVKIAKKIAKAVRESSGGLKNVQAKGVFIEERGLAQVTMNILNFKKTPIPKVFDLVKREALRYGVFPVESEIIGLIPLDAMVGVFKYYLQAHGFKREQILDEMVYRTLLGSEEDDTK